MDFNDVIVQKPWGYEYLLYGNEDVGIWYLNLKHQASTSLHSHPGKKTGLIVIAGLAEISFMNGSQKLYPVDKIMIRENVFHRTKALSHKGLELLEIETPNKKENIIRLEDSYGRAGTPYEGQDHYITNKERITLKGETIIGESLLSLVHTTCKSDLINRDEAKIMVLQGKIYYKEYTVVGAGDIVDNVTLSRLANKFDATPMQFVEIKFNG